MMATNNNDARKKQKITEAVDNKGNSSVTTTPAVVVPPAALSFGTILTEFQDLLFCVLPYIADRVIWNSIASSHKDLQEKSKATRPPWPLCYKLPSSDFLYSALTWSPCSTRIAYAIDGDIVIVDQRRGPLRNHEHINAHGRWNINDLQYSPNGRLLVSAGDDDIIRLWDNTGLHAQLLQEWNMAEEAERRVAVDNLTFSISNCSKYIAVSMGKCVFLKDVEGGNTIKSLRAPLISPNEKICNIKFSSNERAIIICGQQQKTAFVKVWRPYLDDDDDGRLITLWREVESNLGVITFVFSHDNTMVAIFNLWHRNRGIVLSIDNGHKCLTKKFDFQGSTGLHFSPDGKYIIFKNENGRPFLWSIAEGTYTNNTIHLLDIGSKRKHDNLVVQSCSPKNR